MALGNAEELEHELIKRNRDIAKARDDTSKLQQRLKEAQVRNDDLLERVSALEAEKNRLLAKLARLQGQCDSEPNSQRPSINGCYASEIEELRRALSKESTDSCAKKEVDKPSLAQEECKAQMVADLEEERQGHASTRAALVDARLRSKQLEESVQQAQASTEEFHAKRLDQFRLTMIAELDQAHSVARASKCECENLVQHARDQKSELGEMIATVEHLRRELSDHESHAEKFRLAKDEALARHTELGDIHAESMRIATKQNEERLVETTKQIADLEGRLGRQRSCLDAANEALTRCELEEQSLAKLVQKQCDELLAEGVAFETTSARRKEETSADLHLIHERFKFELATHESVAQTKLHSELDEHARAVAEAETTRLSLEAALHWLSSDHEEAQSYHCKAQETSRSQHQELCLRLSTIEAQARTHKQNAESLRRVLEDQRQELEGRLMAQRLELETQQHAPLAEAACWNSLEKDHTSTMKEKDTLLAHSQAKLWKLESELEEAKKRVAEHEAILERQTLDAESKCSRLSMRVVTLERELEVRHERQREVEGQLEPQRQHLEQLSKTVREWQSDRDPLIGAKGSLNGAMSASLEPANRDADNIIKEVHSGPLQGSDFHPTSLEEVRPHAADYLVPRGDLFAAVEAELVTARQRCEQLTRGKADRAQDIAEPIRHNVSMEAFVQEHDAKRERLELELDQQKIFRQTLESDVKVDVGAYDNERALQIEDFNAKLQCLGALLEQERKERTLVERCFATARQDFATKQAQDAAERKRLESEWSSALAASRSQAEGTRIELDACLAQIQSMQRYGNTLDTKRREVEATLLSELSSTEAKVRCLEIETQRAKVAVEKGKAVLAQQRAMMTSCNNSLKMQHDVEDRLDAQRQCLEQLGKTLRQAQFHRDQLIQTEGSLGTQFVPEMSPQGVISKALEFANQDVVRWSSELEARLVRDREAHREALAEVRRSVSHDLRRSGDRLGTVEAELVKARQCCDQLASTKTDVARDLGEHKENIISTESPVQDHLNAAEGLNTEIDNHRTPKQARESTGNEATKQEPRNNQLLVNTLTEQIRAYDDESVLQIDDIEAKVQRLNALLEKESEQRTSTERSLAHSRQDLETMQVQDAVERKCLENMLCLASAALCSQDEETRHELDVCLAQIQSMQNYADTLDTQRHEVEATLQNEFLSTKAKAGRLETETQRAENIVDDCEDVLAQQQATMKSCMDSLERHHEVEGRLEAQRRYLEQVSQKLREAEPDKDILVNTNASLEAQLALHPIQQNVMTARLQLANQDAERSGNELEAWLFSERDAHREALEEVRRSIADDVRLSGDCLAALEAELIIASQSIDDENANVKSLDTLPKQEHKERTLEERSLATPRRDLMRGETHDPPDLKRLDIEMSSALAPWRSQGEETRHELKVCLARIQSMQEFADTLDSQRGEVEATLRDELSSTESKVRLLEIESQRAHSAVEEGKAVLALQQAAMHSRINSLERQLEQETSAARHAYFATGAAERERELLERLAMARDELASRILSFTLERQRLRGALDESRRTLQGSLEMQVVGVEMSLVVGLEQQVLDEKRKSIAATALQRAERTLAHLEGCKKIHDDLNDDASARNRQLERRAATLREQWQRAKLK